MLDGDSGELVAVNLTALDGDHLFHNEGGGKFRDITAASGLANAAFASSAATLFLSFLNFASVTTRRGGATGSGVGLAATLPGGKNLFQTTRAERTGFRKHDDVVAEDHQGRNGTNPEVRRELLLAPDLPDSLLAACRT